MTNLVIVFVYKILHNIGDISRVYVYCYITIIVLITINSRALGVHERDNRKLLERYKRERIRIRLRGRVLPATDTVLFIVCIMYSNVRVRFYLAADRIKTAQMITLWSSGITLIFPPRPLTYRKTFETRLPPRGRRSRRPAERLSSQQ